MRKYKLRYGKGIPVFLTVLVFTNLMFFKGFGQDGITSQLQFPKEKVYVHVNTTTAFVWEYLLYSLSCLDGKTLKPSRVSKIAYVDLIGENGERIFQQKVRLDKGRAYSDFFIPTTVVSGNYKLVGYTRWMQNFDKEEFFRQNITIINPYTSNQSVFLKAERDSLAYGVKEIQKLPSQANYSTSEANSNLAIQLESSKFGPREKVAFSLIPKITQTEDYNVSISVRKIPSMSSPQPITSSSLKASRSKDVVLQSSRPMTYRYLPEIRGELISGRVLDNSTSKPAKAVGVSISFPGYNSHFKTAYTKEDGTFYFSIQEEYEGEVAAIQVLGDENENYELEIFANIKPDVKEKDFYAFRLTEDMQEAILEQSFHNQIENAFFSVKPDTVLTVSSKTPFFLENSLEYKLDDYTRFPTLRETVVEILEHLWIKRESPEKRTFKVRVNPPYSESDKKPLVLMDGIQVLNHENLMDYNARQIEKIAIGRGCYVFGKEVYDGVMSIETFKKDFNLIYDGTSSLEVSLDKPQARKNYFKQNYLDNAGTNNQSIPDFRYQLLWMPMVTANGSSEFSFFTSDVKGKFEIRVEGFSKTGNPISLREIIVVE
ncbi:MAG: hypothetical protein AAGD17_07295 [Bacteroidota bacterium]